MGMSSTEILSDADLLQQLLQFTIGLAKEAGELIRQGSKAVSTVDEKKNAVDLVTKWDKAVEALVKEKILATYGSQFEFIGEESYTDGTRRSLTDAPTFCVDPIDGTTNFVHGFPFACVSIGLLYRKEPVIGVIYNPFLDQLYSALKAHGAYLDDVRTGERTRLPIYTPQPLPSLSSAIVGIEWGSDRSGEAFKKKLGSFTKLAGDGKEIPGGKMVHALRSMGSAAMNYTQVAAGGLDLYWEIGCWPWDVCAGIVIAQEAGGLIRGSPSTLDDADWFTEEFLWGRKYIVVRSIPDTPEETGRDAQLRIMREFYDTVEDWTPM